MESHFHLQGAFLSEFLSLSLRRTPCWLRCRSTSHWTRTLSKDLLVDAVRSRAKISDYFELGQRDGAREQLSGELRMKRSVLMLRPSATVHVTPAEAFEKLRALCASDLFKFVGVPLRKQVGYVTQWVETLVSGRVLNLPDTT